MTCDRSRVCRWVGVPKISRFDSQISDDANIKYPRLHSFSCYCERKQTPKRPPGNVSACRLFLLGPPSLKSDFGMIAFFFVAVGFCSLQTHTFSQTVDHFTFKCESWLWVRHQFD